MRGSSRLVVLVAAACLLVGIAAPSHAAGDAKKKQCAKYALKSGITWDHSDPAAVRLVPRAEWQNCATVKRLELLTYVYDPQGKTQGWDRDDIYRGIDPMTNGKMIVANPRHLIAVGGSPPEPFITDADRNLAGFMSCTKRVNGEDSTLLNGWTFNTVATLYDSRKKVLQKVTTPRVACDQNS